MSGRLLVPGAEPSSAHRCYGHPDARGSLIFRGRYPETALHNVGAVWQCDICALHWLGRVDGTSAYWQPIGRRKARRIIRKASKAEGNQ